jgi:hypothetical protein
MYIEELIGDLLLQHNCVVIPSFGGFVAGQTPATFDATKGQILPPRKSLLFNKQLINNDGLLIAAYAHATKKSYEESTLYIQKQILHWQHKLDAGERIAIDRVGFIFLDSERNIGFEQDKFHNLLLASYGLGKVHFVSQEDIQLMAQQEVFTLAGEPTIASDKENVAPIIEMPNVVAEQEEALPKIVTPTFNAKKVWKYVAAAAILPICFYTYWLPMKTNLLESGIISIQDFNPFHTSGKGLYAKETLDLQIKPLNFDSELDQILKNLPSDVAVFSYPIASDVFVPVKVKEVAPKTERVLPESVKPKVIEVKKVKPSGHLIVGCFSTSENANKLINELKAKGFNAYVVDVKNGLHRVSACNSNSDSTLNKAKEKLAPLEISGWILHN